MNLNLDYYRNSLIKLEDEIIQKIEERLNICKKIGEIKFEINKKKYLDHIFSNDYNNILKKITNKKVEDNIISRIKDKTNNNLELQKIIVRLYKKLLIPKSKKLQVNLILNKINDYVIYLGNETTFSAKAVNIFCENKNLIPYGINSFQNIKRIINKEHIKFFALPKSNNIIGDIESFNNIINKIQIQIIDECDINIEFYIASNIQNNSNNKNIYVNYYSYEQVKNLKEIKELVKNNNVNITNNNYESAKLCKSDNNSYCITNIESIEINDLKIINKINYKSITKFVLLKKNKIE